MIYQIQQTAIFDKWFSKLKNKPAKNQILKRIKNIQQFGYFGDFKSLKNGVFELRIFTNKGYRVYYTKRNSSIILLLGGGTKDTQSKDIAIVKKIIKHLE